MQHHPSLEMDSVGKICLQWMVMFLIASFLLFVSSKTIIVADTNISNNDAMKACLAKFGYTVENFDTFPFDEASSCYREWKSAETKKDFNNLQAFLDEHPWYRGSNWKWEEKAEYTCSKVYNSAIGVNSTLCQKPYYLN